MTDILEQARMALDGVTAGPWRTFNGTDVFPDDNDTSGDNHIADCSPPGFLDFTEMIANARFIAAVRTLVPAMAAEIERLRKRVAELEAKDG